MIIFDIIEITDKIVKGSFIDVTYVDNPDSESIGAKKSLVTVYGKRQEITTPSKLSFNDARTFIEISKPVIVAL